MATSRRPGATQHPTTECRIPGRTPGPLGYLDQGDPNVTTFAGDTPGALGVNDWADPTIGTGISWLSISSMYRNSEGYVLAQTLTPTETLLAWEDIKQDFERWEKLVTHLYLDINGFVTVAVGNMLPTANAARALPFIRRKDVAKATSGEIEHEFEVVSKQAFGAKYGASSYKNKTLLDLPEADCWDLFKKRISNEFIPSLEGYYSGWSAFPVPVKRALLDMAYNLGIGSTAKKTGLKGFLQLKKSVDATNWKKASTQCHRSGNLPKDRNDWTRDLFLAAGALKK